MPIDQLRRAPDLFDTFPERPCQYSENRLRSGYYTALPIVQIDGELRLVWGRSRVERARACGIDELLCREEEVPPGRHAGVAEVAEVADGALTRLLVLALELEERTDDYAPAEQFLIFGYLSAADRATRDRAEKLIASDGGFFGRMERLAGLSPQMRRLVLAGAIDLKTAEAAGHIPPETAVRLADGDLADAFARHSHSERRIFVRTLSDLAARGQTAAPRADALPAEPARDADRVSRIAESALASPAPAEALRRMRYPELTTLTDRFDDLASRVKKASGARLSAPPYFEGASFTLEIPFRNCRELDERLSRASVTREYCDELFALLR